MSRRLGYLTVFLSWFISVFLIPGFFDILAKPDLPIFSASQKSSVPNFPEKVLRAGKSLMVYERFSLIFPTCYLNFVSGEVSSLGYSEYIDFYKKNVEILTSASFAPTNSSGSSGSEGNSVLLFGQSRLPASFPIGISVAFFANFLLLFISFLILYKRELNRDRSVIKIPERFDPGKAYFIFCKGDEVKTKVFEGFCEDENYICINEIGRGVLDIDIGLNRWVNYLSEMVGVEKKGVWEKLSILGIDILKADSPGHPDFIQGEIPDEYLLKIYYGILMLGSRKNIVLNDIFRGKSRDFEKVFTDFIMDLNRMGKTILYLGSEMMTARFPFEIDSNAADYTCFEIEPGQVSFRSCE